MSWNLRKSVMVPLDIMVNFRKPFLDAFELWGWVFVPLDSFQCLKFYQWLHSLQYITIWFSPLGMIYSYLCFLTGTSCYISHLICFPEWWRNHFVFGLCGSHRSILWTSGKQGEREREPWLQPMDLTTASVDKTPAVALIRCIVLFSTTDK